MRRNRILVAVVLLVVVFTVAGCDTNIGKERFVLAASNPEYDIFLDMQSIIYTKTTDMARY